MYDELTRWDNLLRAYRNASRGKRGQPNVAVFEYALEEELFQLQHELRTFSYRPGGYLSFPIHEPKRRLISAAPFRDRVVHHALCQMIEPPWERRFIYDSYANRVGKGTHRALDRCQQFLRRYRYVLPCDIRQFFPSIDHAFLHQKLATECQDDDILWLIDEILQSGRDVLSEEYRMVYFAGDEPFAANRPRGLPIGNLTSQFWANVYLDSFDHFVKRSLRCRAYLRYVDDFLLFANDKATLWQWKAAIEPRLAALRLTMHDNAAPRPTREGLSFLGFRLFPQRRRLKREKGLYYRRKLRQMQRQNRAGHLSYALIHESIRGWVAHVRYANTIGLRKALFRPLRWAAYPEAT
ncbi:MAG: hypothetical protein KDD73_15145 [Anaerolineales bacterium]|nr:hypothetical protein [Anaerolineales bacterium]